MDEICISLVTTLGEWGGLTRVGHVGFAHVMHVDVG